MIVKQGFSVRVQKSLISLVPVLLALLTFALCVGMAQSSAFGMVRPMVLAISVYYWTLFYPSLMPYPAVFALGIVEDSVSGGLFGISALVLVLAKYLTSRWLKNLSKMGFKKIWLGAALVMSLIAVVRFIAEFATSGVIPAFTPPVLQLVFSVLLYPPLHIFLSHIHGIIFKR